VCLQPASRSQKILGLVFRMWRRADSSWRDVHCQGSDSNDFLYSGARLGSTDQRVVWFVNSFQAWTWGGFFVYALNALIRGVTGYLLIRHPDAGASAVTMVLAVLFIVGGICRVIGASSIQCPRWGWTASAYSVSHFSLRGLQRAPTLSAWQSALISSLAAGTCWGLRLPFTACQ
jgi:hypothetical protein